MYFIQNLILPGCFAPAWPSTGVLVIYCMEETWKFGGTGSRVNADYE